MKRHILLIDDDKELCTIMDRSLTSKGAKVSVAGTAQAGLGMLTQNMPDLVLLDISLPDASGVDLVGEIKATNEDIPILMVSGHGEAHYIVDAMQAGASDYVQKPVEFDKLWEKISELLKIREAQTAERDLEHATTYGSLIGKSQRTRQLIREMSKVAHSDASVLLRGESGTGKSFVAELLHTHSHRAKKPFVTINCAAIPENLLESELFGHVKGAFTGAIRNKEGKFELANEGTIFLDEIGDLSPELQVKLLRVLQGREFERVGGLKTISVDVRIIAATNRDLEQAMTERRFREDLFYRLNVLPIYIPPLRERKEDIPLLINHFVKYYSKKANKQFEPLQKNIIDQLINYSWPGNIRELQNIIERAIVLGREPRLRPADFVVSSATSPPKTTPEPDVTSLLDLEYRTLMKALEKAGSNISKAAEILGVSRNTIYRRLKKYNIGLKGGVSDDHQNLEADLADPKT